MIDPKVPLDAFSGKNWSREQLKLVFYLYCQTPFGQLHSTNPKIVELANLIGRTHSAVAMKCVNFASLDPAIRDSGRRGLSNASKLDREVWDEFHADWERLAEESASLYHYLQHERGPSNTDLGDPMAEFDLDDYTGETRETLVTQRIRQGFFRRAVLSSYRGRCCVSGISDARLLIASHIVPWREDKSNRLNPSNGLCLSAIHDKAFDAHLFTLSDDWRVVLSGTMKQTKDTFLQDIFWRAEGKQIELPERFFPDLNFVTSHRIATLQNNAKPVWRQ